MSEPKHVSPPRLASGEPARGELVAWLIANGASEAEIEGAASVDDWNLLAGDVAVRTGRPTVSLQVAAKQVGLPYEEVVAVWRACGFVIPEEDAPVLAEAEIDGFFNVIGLALQVFGLDATIQLVRVVSSSVSTIADAVISVFHTRLGLEAAKDDPSGLAVALSASAAAAPLAPLGRAVELLLRRHIVGLMRPLVVSDADSLGYDAVEIAVGFVDLVGFTTLTNQQSFAELDAAIGEFNEAAHRVVSSHGGRVVKLIGDEVMFVAPSADGAVGAVSALLDHLSAAGLPEGRGGIAWGATLTRDGDYFGPCVNLASRLTKLAAPNSAWITADLHSQLSIEFRGRAGVLLVPGEPAVVRGFDAPVSVFVVS